MNESVQEEVFKQIVIKWGMRLPMEENEKLLQRVEALEQRVKFLEETFETLSNIRASDKAGEYIELRKRALSVSKLVSGLASNESINVDAQANAIDTLQTRKKTLDEKIRTAIADSEAKADSAVNINDFNYTEIEDGIEILGYKGFDMGDTLIIPTTISGKSVISIGKDAFVNGRMKEVVLPRELKYIKDSAFKKCKYLNRVLLPPKLQEMGPSAFTQTGICEVIIPDSVTKIGYMCFFACNNLKRAVWGTSCNTIESSMFENGGLEKIIIPENVNSIRQNAFGTFNFRSKMEIAILGMKTAFWSSIPREAIVYCLAGSAAQRQAQLAGAEIHPLSEFKFEN